MSCPWLIVMTSLSGATRNWHLFAFASAFSGLLALAPGPSRPTVPNVRFLSFLFPIGATVLACFCSLLSSFLCFCLSLALAVCSHHVLPLAGCNDVALWSYKKLASFCFLPQLSPAFLLLLLALRALRCLTSAFFRSFFLSVPPFSRAFAPCSLRFSASVSLWLLLFALIMSCPWLIVMTSLSGATRNWHLFAFASAFSGLLALAPGPSRPTVPNVRFLSFLFPIGATVLACFCSLLSSFLCFCLSLALAVCSHHVLPLADCNDVALWSYKKLASFCFLPQLSPAFLLLLLALRALRCLTSAFFRSFFLSVPPFSRAFAPCSLRFSASVSLWLLLFALIMSCPWLIVMTSLSGATRNWHLFAFASAFSGLLALAPGPSRPTVPNVRFLSFLFPIGATVLACFCSLLSSFLCFCLSLALAVCSHHVLAPG